jgi:hypothetical protein
MEQAIPRVGNGPEYARVTMRKRWRAKDGLPIGIAKCVTLSTQNGRNAIDGNRHGSFKVHVDH